MMAGLSQTPQSAASRRPANGGGHRSRHRCARHSASRRQRLCTGPGPQPQPRPRMSPEEFQRAVFTNGPNTGNEAQDFSLSRTPFVAVCVVGAWHELAAAGACSIQPAGCDPVHVPAAD